LPFSINA